MHKPDNPVWQERRENEGASAQDHRSAYDRDYGRIIHSAAFRRLQSKTQILGLGDSDFYRTRLTHSLEVMQIGAGIVSNLQHRYHDHPAITWLPSPTLIEAICLAHDIGHPPFGHAGESMLNYCMHGHGGFEGNGQTLRILSRLEKYSAKHGLNPTRRLLLGVLKYPAPYSKFMRDATINKSPNAIDYSLDLQSELQSWLLNPDTLIPPKCYLDAEAEVINWVLSPFSECEQNAFSTISNGKTIYKALDASIMELADDISYGVHDFEDGIALHLINREDLLTLECPEDFPITKEEFFTNIFDEAIYKRKKTIGRLVHYFITQASFKEVKDFDQPLLRYNLELPEQAAIFLKFFKAIVFKKMIHATNVRLQEVKGRKIISTLFAVFNSAPDKLLPGYEQKKYTTANDLSEKKRVICDYIAGMTDQYAAKLYQKITNPGYGSIFDHL